MISALANPASSRGRRIACIVPGIRSPDTAAATVKPGIIDTGYKRREKKIVSIRVHSWLIEG
jgi:hypothetical protein